MHSACCIHTIIDKRDRLALVCSFEPECRRVEKRAQILALLCDSHPHLRFHPCSNEHGVQFGLCLKDTPVVHVFEHLILDYLMDEAPDRQVAERVNKDQDRSLKHKYTHLAWSTWRNKEEGRAYIEISYCDKNKVLRAIELALKEFNQAAREVDYDKRTYDI